MKRDIKYENGALIHADDGSAVQERARKERLLCRREADGIIEVVTNFAHGGVPTRPRAFEGICSNTIFSTESDKTGGDQASAPLRVAVGDVEGTKVRVCRVRLASGQKLRYFRSNSRTQSPSRPSSNG